MPVALDQSGRVHAVGIDLAWGNHPSGVAHLVGPVPRTNADEGWRLLESARLPHPEAVAAWMCNRIPMEAPVWVAVDAPLVAHNPAGTQRAADAALSAAFRRFKVVCLPVDERHAEMGNSLVERLDALDIVPAIPEAAGAARRGVFETFPAAAHLPLFELRRPLGYKRGPVDKRREGLRRLQTRIALMDDAALRLESTTPLRNLLAADPAALRGDGLKDLEDRLDAMLCALVAALGWSAPERLVTFGNVEEGAITVPHPPAGPGE